MISHPKSYAAVGRHADPKIFSTQYAVKIFSVRMYALRTQYLLICVIDFDNLIAILPVALRVSDPALRLSLRPACSTVPYRSTVVFALVFYGLYRFVPLPCGVKIIFCVLVRPVVLRLF